MAQMTNTLTWVKTKLTGTGGTNAVANNDLLYKIKNHFKTIGWSVVMSSDGSARFGASDYWDSGTNIVHAVAGSNHSWIVLSNDSICTGYQLCIDFAISTTATGFFYISINGTGFTGGSLTARPTATDEVQMNLSSDYWSSYSSGTAPTANVFSSTDYSSTNVYLGPTTVRGVWIFAKPINAPSWFTKPNVSLINNGTCVHANFDGTGEDWTTGNFNGLTVKFSLGTLVIGTSRCLTLASVAGNSGDYGGNWPYTPMWLLPVSSPCSGECGILPDVWWLHNNATLTLGDFFPGDGTGQQVVIGNFGQGNDGSALSL